MTIVTKYCNCHYCLKNQEIVNPYGIYHNKLFLSGVSLEFDYRTTALCRYGCEKFRKKPTCPPNIPGIEYYSNVLNEYEGVFVLGRKYPYSDGLFSTHWRNYSTREIHELVLKKEIELFNNGFVYSKAFIGGSCKLCSPDVCKSHKCVRPHKGRVPIEATGINILSLMTAIGLEYQEPPVDYFWRLGLVFF